MPSIVTWKSTHDLSQKRLGFFFIIFSLFFLCLYFYLFSFLLFSNIFVYPKAKSQGTKPNVYSWMSSDFMLIISSKHKNQDKRVMYTKFYKRLTKKWNKCFNPYPKGSTLHEIHVTEKTQECTSQLEKRHSREKKR